jgi:cytochrome b
MDSINVWDIFVRIFHWALVGSMLGLYISAEEMQGVHIRLGYFVIGLVLARFVWGFIGTKHARFGDFLYKPSEIFRYLKRLFTSKPIHYLGHNPAGGLMVLVMLIAVLATTFAGLKALAAEGKGPLANTNRSFLSSAYADEDEHEADEEHHAESGRNNSKDESWEKIHKGMTNFMLFLIAIHLCGVLVSSWLHRENLILSMITGKKKAIDRTAS